MPQEQKMTSNLGSQMIQQMSGSDPGLVKVAVLAEVKTQFRPEFVNRIDEMVRFRALTPADLAPIVEIQLDHLRERLADRRITLEVTDAGRAALVEAGYDPAFGARPLKRVIQRQVADRLANALLDGTVVEGATVEIDASSEGVTLSVSEA